jgi:hypothetical protein
VFLDATEDKQIATEIKRLNRDWADGVKDMELHTADEDRPTRPEQITSAATPIGYIEAGERLMGKLRAEDQHLHERVWQRKQRPRFPWRGVMVAFLVGLLLAWLLVTQCWGTG